MRCAKRMKSLHNSSFLMQKRWGFLGGQKHQCEPNISLYLQDLNKKRIFWRPKASDISLFIEDINNENIEIKGSRGWHEDDLSQEPWSPHILSEHQIIFTFFVSNLSLPWKEGSVEESFAYNNSIEAKEDEQNKWNFTAIGEERRGEEDRAQASLLLQEIERILLEEICGSCIF